MKYTSKLILNGQEYEFAAPSGGGRQPGANTLLYMPLSSDDIDVSGNFTSTSTSVTYTTVGGVTSAHVGTTGGISLSPTNILTTSVSELTWMAYINMNVSGSRVIFEFAIQGINHFSVACADWTSYQIRTDGTNTGDELYGPVLSSNTRYHVATTNSSSGKKLYLNGVLEVSGTGSSTPGGARPSGGQNGQYVMCSRNGPDDGQSLDGNMSELIMEDKVRTAQEIQDYYNQTKSLYGIS